MSELRHFPDDDRDGFELRVLRSDVDGDFWLSIVPTDDMDIEERCAPGSRLYSNHIRVRMPMIGGGRYPKLYDALVRLFKSDEGKQ